MRNYLFTSESVTEGHPDKICDRVSDAILDALLASDPESRVALETAVKDQELWLFGEITTRAQCDYDAIVRKAIEDIGYTDDCGFSPTLCRVRTNILAQSPDIALGVDRSYENKENETADLQHGAGDQGMMFGFACDETQELMPLPISLANRLSRALTAARKQGQLPWLRPDGKSQVTVEYIDDRPVRIDTVVMSTQHTPEIDLQTLRRELKEHVILPNLPQNLVDENTKFFINPTGRFVTGGPVGDSGLTGRKIIVDTYGGYSRHGGGCFSGKDPSKVDRSATYMARYVAKNIVAAKLAKKCEVQLAYAIGVAQPVSVFVDTFGSSEIDQEILTQAVFEIFDLRPDGIIRKLDLKKPIYTPLSSYGHIGREDLEVAWEKTDSASKLLESVERLQTVAGKSV